MLPDLEGFIDDGKPAVQKRKSGNGGVDTDKMRLQIMAQVTDLIDASAFKSRPVVPFMQETFQPSSTPAGDTRRFLGQYFMLLRLRFSLSLYCNLIVS